MGSILVPVSAPSTLSTPAVLAYSREDSMTDVGAKQSITKLLFSSAIEPVDSHAAPSNDAL